MARGTPQRIPVDAIEVADRLRPVDTAYVQFLALSIADAGLEQPIVVRPGNKPDRWRLMAGAHRLAATKLNGDAEIDAIVRTDVKTDDEARLVEIAENLMRRELSALDRAIFLSEWRATMQRLHPELARGGDRKSFAFAWKNQSANLALWSDVAQRVGLSDRSIQRACSIAERLDAKAVVKLRGTALEDNQRALEKLAKLPRAQQAKAVQRALEGSAAPTKPDADAAYLRVLRLAWQLTKAQRARLVEELTAEGGS